MTEAGAGLNPVYTENHPGAPDAGVVSGGLDPGDSHPYAAALPSRRNAAKAPSSCWI